MGIVCVLYVVILVCRVCMVCVIHQNVLLMMIVLVFSRIFLIGKVKQNNNQFQSAFRFNTLNCNYLANISPDQFKGKRFTFRKVMDGTGFNDTQDSGSNRDVFKKKFTSLSRPRQPLRETNANLPTLLFKLNKSTHCHIHHQRVKMVGSHHQVNLPMLQISSPQ